MKVVIFGGTGFIGGHLVELLEGKGHSVELADIRRDHSWKSKIKEADAVVNLAGANLFKKRWSTQYKSLIHSSRVEGTEKIVEAMGQAGEKRPKVFVSGSAIGIYPSSRVQEIDESSELGSNFLAFVCKEWEDAALAAKRKYGIRTVCLRTGIVLGKDGGALQKLLLPFKLGLGGPIDLGKEWFSWIHIDDICGLILHALENTKVEGPLNGTAPNPVRNKDFAKALGSALHRPAFLPTPSVALRVMLGEVASVITEGQCVKPQKALDTGYPFKFPELAPALKDLLA